MLRSSHRRASSKCPQVAHCLVELPTSTDSALMSESTKISKGDTERDLPLHLRVLIIEENILEANVPDLVMIAEKVILEKEGGNLHHPLLNHLSYQIADQDRKRQK